MKKLFQNLRIVDKSGIEKSFEAPRRKQLSVVVIILCFVVSIFGGVIGMVLATAAPDNVQKWLGIYQVKNFINDTIKTEKVVVQEESATVDVVKDVSPAVVSILYTKNVTVSDPFDLYGQGQKVIEEQGGGTGFVITSDGLIVTNKHVVSDENAKYTVITANGDTYDAEVLALDPTLDLAVVKIDAKGLSVVKLGSSKDVKVGQKVVAIGNSLGEFQNSVTVGVISATGRKLVSSDIAYGQDATELEGLLQTDAAINLGNSGGPLVNLRGQVIGINTATAAKSQAEGIGFAIPIDVAKNAIESVKKTGKIVRPYLGVNTVEVTKEIADLNKLPISDGFLVTGDTKKGIPAVVSGSPADKAGLREGDIITEVNGEKVGHSLSLIAAIRDYAPDDTIELVFNRGGDSKSIKVNLTERPE